uniref:Uncharacterized protein n=1 Tax=Oryza nivara TaxID=4536 RepID=A0A0E0GT88_ORYNI
MVLQGAGKSIGSWKQQCKLGFLSIVALRGACGPHCPLWASLRCIIALTVRRGQDRKCATIRGWSRCARLQRIVRRFPLHFSLSSIGDDEQPTTIEINYFFCKLEGACAPIAPCGLRSVASLHPRCGEGKIEEALLVAVDRDVLIYKESFPLHFSLSSIGDNEQPPTMEINYFFHPLFYELKEGRIEEALLVAVGRDVLVYKESALGLLELLYGDVSVDMWFEAPK